MKWKIVLTLILAAPVAHAEPWVCTDADGNKSFNYEPESARMKNCVHHPIPSGNVWRKRPSSDYVEAPVDFPKVDRKTQKQRDATRRELLERELADEKKALEAAMRQLEDQKRLHTQQKNYARVEERLKPYEDRIRVHLSNIANLEKELGGKG